MIQHAENINCRFEKKLGRLRDAYETDAPKSISTNASQTFGGRNTMVETNSDCSKKMISKNV